MKKLLFPASLLLFFHGSYAQWVNDPLLNTVAATGTEFINPVAASDSNGATFISYREYNGGGYNMRMQRLDENGYALWGTGGLLVSADDSNQTYTTVYTMQSDPENNAIVTWEDNRNGNFDVFASKVTHNGSLPWTAGGVQLSASTDADDNPQVLPMNGGTAVFAWQTDDSTGIRMQRLSGAGSREWQAGGNLYYFPATNTLHCLSYPHLVVSGDTTFYMIYKNADAYFNASFQILEVMLFGESGQALWSNPLILATGGIPNFLTLNAIPDGSGGTVIAWLDSRLNGFTLSGFVQHVSENGTILFASGGSGVVSGTTIAFDNIVPVWDGTNVTVFFSTTNDIWMQRMDTAGNLLLGNSGISISTTPNAFRELQAQQSGEDYVVSWVEDLTFPNSVMRAAKLDTTGSFVWTPGVTDVSTASGSKGDATLCRERNSELVIAWADDRTGSNEIYAQNINANGSLGTYLNNMSYTDFRIFPNPAGSQISFQQNHPGTGTCTFSLYNPEGRKVFSGSVQGGEVRMDVSRFEAGLYFWEFISGDAVYSGKVAIIH